MGRGRGAAPRSLPGNPGGGYRPRRQMLWRWRIDNDRGSRFVKLMTVARRRSERSWRGSSRLCLVSLYPSASHFTRHSLIIWRPPRRGWELTVTGRLRRKPNGFKTLGSHTAPGDVHFNAAEARKFRMGLKNQGIGIPSASIFGCRHIIFIRGQADPAVDRRGCLGLCVSHLGPWASPAKSQSQVRRRTQEPECRYPQTKHKLPPCRGLSASLLLYI